MHRCNEKKLYFTFFKLIVVPGKALIICITQFFVNKPDFRLMCDSFRVFLFHSNILTEYNCYDKTFVM